MIYLIRQLEAKFNAATTEEERCQHLTKLKALELGMREKQNKKYDSELRKTKKQNR
jgi:hypothetical protein